MAALADIITATAAELLGEEGEVLRVYDDATGKLIVKGTTVLGNPTIGRGRNLSSRGITAAESLALCSDDVTEAASQISAALPWFANLTANRAMALVILYFNLDLGNIARFTATWPQLLSQLAAGLYAAAADNLESTQPWATQVGPGRAQRLGEFLRYG